MSSTAVRLSNVISWIGAAFLVSGGGSIVWGLLLALGEYYDWNDPVIIGGVLLFPWLILGIINYIWVGSFRVVPWKRVTQIEQA